jgi:NAD(P)H-hydrate epimerase
VSFTPDHRQALLTVAQMAAADRAAMAAGIAGPRLMAAAGHGVFEAIVNRFAPQRTVVLCGPGNNGGDGFVVAEKLRRAGWDVAVASLVERSALQGDAAWAASHWHGETSIARDDSVLDERSLVVDALFGAGLARPLDGVARALVEAINARGLIAVGVDVPSGLQGDSGQVLGAAPRCALTVTFFRLKPGHLLLPGRTLCGETVVVDIGTPPHVLEAIAPKLWRNHPDLWRADLRRRELDDHKYRRGHALIYGGAAMTGAARLAALAARRAGAGLATIAAPASSGGVYRAGDAGTIVADCEFPDDYGRLLGDPRFNAVVLGPGLGRGPTTRRLVAQALTQGRTSHRRFVLDADALTSFADQPAALFNMVDASCVLTPHEGEFSSIFSVIKIDFDKLDKARRAAEISGAIVLLKGADTVVAAPDGRAVINANAPPSLATAGAGDVLAGIVTGLLAQGMEPFSAACAAVWIHGAAAHVAGLHLIAEDLAPALPRVFQHL